MIEIARDQMRCRSAHNESPFWSPIFKEWGTMHEHIHIRATKHQSFRRKMQEKANHCDEAGGLRIRKMPAIAAVMAIELERSAIASSTPRPGRQHHYSLEQALVVNERFIVNMDEVEARLQYSSSNWSRWRGRPVVVVDEFIIVTEDVLILVVVGPQIQRVSLLICWKERLIKPAMMTNTPFFDVFNVLQISILHSVKLICRLNFECRNLIQHNHKNEIFNYEQSTVYN